MCIKNITFIFNENEDKIFETDTIFNAMFTKFRPFIKMEKWQYEFYASKLLCYNRDTNQTLNDIINETQVEQKVHKMYTKLPIQFKNKALFLYKKKVKYYNKMS